MMRPEDVLPELDIEPLREIRLIRVEVINGRPERVVESWIYFIQGDDGGPIKIGRTSKWPGFRLTEIQMGYPFGWLRVVGLLRGRTGLEREYHRRFNHLRIRGEWFRAEPELVEFIKCLPEVP